MGKRQRCNYLQLRCNYDAFLTASFPSLLTQSDGPVGPGKAWQSLGSFLLKVHNSRFLMFLMFLTFLLKGRSRVTFSIDSLENLTFYTLRRTP